MNLTDTYIVYGLGKSGIATAKAILKAGGKVYIGDDNPIQDDFLPEAQRLDLSMGKLPAAKALVAAPGIPLTHPKPHKVFDMAHQKNIPIICDIELFYHIHHTDPNVKWIAITGTNGKSTVTDLTTHILNQAGHRAFAGGNIGVAAFDLPIPDGKPLTYVLEISSYQADLCHEFAPDAVGFLNLTPDHIDRHGSMDGYLQSKMRLFQHLGTKGKAYIAGHQERQLNQWEEQALQIAKFHKALFFHTAEDRGQIQNYCRHHPILAGEHQYMNALTACALAKMVDCSDFSGIISYLGLEHRCEFVKKIDNIIFINDSKATNAEATKPALEAYKNIFWLAGGVAKAEGIAPLLQTGLDTVIKAYFYGEAKDNFAKAAEGIIPYVTTDTLENALKMAFNDAKTNESEEKTILLSPSCASFDQFKNFEQRGTAFKEIIGRL